MSNRFLPLTPAGLTVVPVLRTPDRVTIVARPFAEATFTPTTAPSIIVRERNGRSVPAIFASESAALAWIRLPHRARHDRQRRRGARLGRAPPPFEMRRIDHSQAYSADGACTNMAKEYFSRLRRAEAGHHHHIAGAYLLRYAQEASWREDNHRMSNGDQTRRVAALVLVKATRPDFVGYWQRHLVV